MIGKSLQKRNAGNMVCLDGDGRGCIRLQTMPPAAALSKDIGLIRPEMRSVAWDDMER